MTISTLSHPNLIIEFVITRRTASHHWSRFVVIVYLISEHTSKGQTRGKAAEVAYVVVVLYEHIQFSQTIRIHFWCTERNVDEHFVTVLTTLFLWQKKRRRLPTKYHHLKVDTLSMMIQIAVTFFFLATTTRQVGCDEGVKGGGGMKTATKGQSQTFLVICITMVVTGLLILLMVIFALLVIQRRYLFRLDNF